MNVNDVMTWPPGSRMIANIVTKKNERLRFLRFHGMVVSNDGINRISVVWSAPAHAPFCTYHVAFLNKDVIVRLT